jgi:hypothetical protein
MVSELQTRSGLVPPFSGCFLEQLGSGVLPFALDCPDSTQSTSTCPPPETDEEIGHDGAINVVPSSHTESEHGACVCASPVARTSSVPDSPDNVSESEDDFESPGSRRPSGSKR